MLLRSHKSPTGYFQYDQCSQHARSLFFQTNEHIWRLIPKHSEDAYLSYKPQSQEICEVPTYIRMPPLLAAMTKAENPDEVGIFNVLALCAGFIVVAVTAKFYCHNPINKH